MVVVSYSGREINAKIVYYGPGLSGKTTNLEKIYDSVPEANRGRMVSMKTQTDRTLFFDLLPLDLGELSGMKTRFLLYTVPGQVYYNATRKLVLKGVDAIVFVADSARDKMAENRESLSNLETNLRSHGLDLHSIPWVLQCNKRDLPDVVSVEEMNRELNRYGVPSFESQAANGIGVFETLRGVSKLLLSKISHEVMDRERGNLATLPPVEAAQASPQPALVEQPKAPEPEPEKKSGGLMQFLRRGKQQEAAPEPIESAPPASTVPPGDSVYPEPEPIEHAPLLTDADLVDEEPAAPGTATGSGEWSDYVLSREDLIPDEPKPPIMARTAAAGEEPAQVFGTGEIERESSYDGRTEAAPSAGEGGRSVVVPVEIGPVPASGRIRLTFEVRIEVLEEDESRAGRSADAEGGTFVTEELRVYR